MVRALGLYSQRVREGKSGHREENEVIGFSQKPQSKASEGGEEGGEAGGREGGGRVFVLAREE